MLKPGVMRYKEKVSHIYVRGDAGFANPDVYEFLEAEGCSNTSTLLVNPNGRIVGVKPAPIWEMSV